MTNLIAISCVFDWHRGHDIEDVLSYSSSFSDVIDSNAKFPSKGIAFISLDGEGISYVMMYKKSGRVATKKDRLTFRKPVLIEPALPLEKINESMPSNLKKHFQSQITEGISAFSPKVYSSLRKFIKDEYPSISKDIEKLEKEIGGRIKYRGRGAEIIAHEKDAVGLALRISGFTDNDIPKWSSDNKPAPFLQGYDEVVIREDPMVIHDSQVFGDWNKVSQYVVGAAEFIKDGHKLTIMNVNRLKVEETLGVDLIMYHHTFKSYVMVQYKRMTKNGDTLGYRPVDKSYRSEISRMENIRNYSSSPSMQEPEEYRLNDELFYFKLCPAKIEEPLSTEMIAGMYLPFSYWKLLLSSKGTLGSKGGRLITYNNVSRYINNTLFIELVQNGWVGSQVDSVEVITKLIQDAIQGERSVILAKYVPSKNNT